MAYHHAPILYDKKTFDKINLDVFDAKKLCKTLKEAIWQKIGLPIHSHLIFHKNNDCSIKYSYLTNEPIDDSDDKFIMRNVTIKIIIEHTNSYHPIKEDAWTREMRKLKEELKLQNK